MDHKVVAWMVGVPDESPALYNLSQREEAFDAAQRWNRPISALVVHPLDFVIALKIAERVFEQYSKDQPKWWKRMDGTPILNDVAVRMAQAFVKRQAEERANG